MSQVVKRLEKIVIKKIIIKKIAMIEKYCDKEYCNKEDYDNWKRLWKLKRL